MPPAEILGQRRAAVADFGGASWVRVRGVYLRWQQPTLADGAPTCGLIGHVHGSGAGSHWNPIAKGSGIPTPAGTGTCEFACDPSSGWSFSRGSFQRGGLGFSSTQREPTKGLIRRRLGGLNAAALRRVGMNCLTMCQSPYTAVNGDSLYQVRGPWAEASGIHPCCCRGWCSQSQKL